MGELTKRTVDAIGPTGAERFVWDADLPGFGIRVSSAGAKSYVVKYRAGRGRGAPTRRVSLGSASVLTPEEARRLARKSLGAVAHGHDPAAERTRERGSPTLSALIDLFLAEHVEATRKAATLASYRDVLDRLARPALGTTKADKVTRAMVAKLTSHRAARPVRRTGSSRYSPACTPLPTSAASCPMGSTPLEGSSATARPGASAISRRTS